MGTELAGPPPLGLVTQLVPLQSIRAEEGAAALKQIAAPTARIESVARSNALLITDRGSNVVRYLELVHEILDFVVGDRIYVADYEISRRAERIEEDEEPPSEPESPEPAFSMWGLAALAKRQ